MDEYLESSFDFTAINANTKRLLAPDDLTVKLERQVFAHEQWPNYKYWLMPDDEFVFRFLPDKNPENPFFWLWKGRSSVLQAFVLKGPSSDVQPGENPIRRLVFTRRVIDIIQQALLDPDLLAMPTNYERGADFRLVKNFYGPGHHDLYRGAFIPHPRPLTFAEREAIAQYGLVDLRDWC